MADGIVNGELPAVDVRRQILEARRQEFQRMGYAFEVEIEVLGAQDVSRPADATAQVEQIDILRTQAANAYAAAGRVKQLIDALPKPPTKPELAK